MQGDASCWAICEEKKCEQPRNYCLFEMLQMGAVGVTAVNGGIAAGFPLAVPKTCARSSDVVQADLRCANEKVVVEKLRLDYDIPIQYVGRHHLRFGRCLY